MHSESRYTHIAAQHHLDVSPSIICPIVYELIQPKSVIDIGCGVVIF